MSRLRLALWLLLLLSIALPAGALPAPNEYVEVTIPTQKSIHGILQSEAYRIRISGQTLQIALNGADGTNGELLVYAPNEDRIHMQHSFGAAGNLQFTSTYSPSDLILVIAPNPALELVLGAENLQVSPLMPALRADPEAPFQTIGDTYTLQPELLNPDATGQVLGLVNGEVYADDLLQEGAIQPFALDFSEAEEGPYWISIVAPASEGGNVASIERSVLIDRIDGFPDVPRSHWARTPVELMHDIGVLNGRGAGFEPAAHVTRAEFAKMMVLTFGVNGGVPSHNIFDDVPDDHWAITYIVAAAQLGWIRGEIGPNDTRLFFPERTITRAEAAAMVGRAMRMGGPRPAPDFTDWEQVPGWAQPFVAGLAELGWLTGYPDGTYRPDGLLQRDAAAQVLARRLGL